MASLDTPARTPQNKSGAHVQKTQPSSKPTEPLDTDSFDLVIVGGGLIGASLACALGGKELKIALIEAHPMQSGASPSYDDRAIALSYGTAQIFRTLDLWPELAKEITPISRIHVSDKGHIGVTRINACEENVDALGYVISARALGNILFQRLSALTNITLLNPVRLSALQSDSSGSKVTVASDAGSSQHYTRLVVAADGGSSTTRELLGIDSSETDYRQTAITANITLDRPHGNTAYERFTANGPLALLPIQKHDCSLVWTHPEDQHDKINALNDEEFLRALQDEFGYRAGRFVKVGKRSSYPLKLVKVRELINPRTVLIGNAAHTLHPIAGQGFNLGMRDVAVLAQIIVDNMENGRDIGSAESLSPYLAWRKKDQRNIVGLTDNLVRIFSNRFAPLALARNLGLLTMDIFPPAKHMLAKHTMGLAGKLPRLTRGLPL